MIIYKDKDNSVHEIESRDFAYLLPPGSIEITEEEAVILRAPDAAQVWAAYQDQARTLITASDLVVIRCAEAGVGGAAAWVAYRKMLRAVIGASSGDATKPLQQEIPSPAGT